jgi:hypothetical protein
MYREKSSVANSNAAVCGIEEQGIARISLAISYVSGGEVRKDQT